MCRQVASPSPDLSPWSWSPGHPLQTRLHEWQPSVSALRDVLLGLHRGRAAAQGVAVLLWCGSRELSFEPHGFEFWRLCLFVVIFWPMLRTRARTAVMQACSMGRSLLEREKCSGDVLSRRPEPSQRRRLCAGSGCTATRGEARWKQEALAAPSRAAPWRGICTVVSLRGPGVASQSPFASRFQVPSRVSPHPQQCLNIFWKEVLARA